MGKKAVFGRELADAYQAKKPLPTLIERSAYADDDHSMLNEIILQMTVFDSKKRMQMKDVIEKIEAIGTIISKRDNCNLFETNIN